MNENKGLKYGFAMPKTRIYNSLFKGSFLKPGDYRKVLSVFDMLAGDANYRHFFDNDFTSQTFFTDGL